jgi:hypothetical protein
MYRTIPIMCTLALLFASVAFRPKPNGDCVKIPRSFVWTGQATMGSDNLHTRQEGITLEEVSGNVWKISDITAGYFAEFGESGQPADVYFNCDHSVRATAFDTPFGWMQITGGQYDAGKKTLTVHWQIPSNGLKETSIFTLN